MKLLVVRKSKIDEFVLYLFIFFPYLTMFTGKFDTSAYALIVSLVIFSFHPLIKVPKELMVLFLLFLFSVAVMLISDISLNAFRSIAGYLSIHVIAVATYYIMYKNKSVNCKLIYKFTVFWFFVGTVQVLVFPEFLTFLMTRTTTDEERGVVSLAPEPTYYATVALFLYFISFVNNYKVKETIFMTIVTALLLAMSSTALLLGFVILVFYFFINILNMKKIIILLFTLVGLYVLITNIDFNTNARIYTVATKIIDKPEILFIADGSANARLWNIVGAFMGAYDNYLLPNGYESFQESLLSNINHYSRYSHPFTLEIVSNKIMSGVGQMVFELGFFFFLYFYSFFMLSYRFFKSIKKSLFLTLSVFLVMTTAVPLTFPMFGFLYGLLAFKAHESSQ